MIIYFGIGSNLGDRDENIRLALCLLDELVGEQLACSSIYRSEPHGFISDNEFANIVAVYDTHIYSLLELLNITQQIERELGRTQKSINGIYHDRMIDIDLLVAYQSINGEQSPINCQLPDLQLPHPRIQERDFVLVPLNEVKDKMQKKYK
jgi:2-amino-4-hydroxy-6-hydroxymethyldihydropteridine diphosphokinase